VIIGSYRLQLYCNQPECERCLVVDGRIYQTRGSCNDFARSQGWVVGTLKAWCPDHTKGKR